MSEAPRAPRRRTLEVAPEPAPASSPTPALALDDVARVERFLRRLVETRYFGKVTVSFQNGRVTDIRTEQVMKVDDL